MPRAGAFFVNEGARANITRTLLCGNNATTGAAALIGGETRVVYNPRCCKDARKTDACFKVRALPSTAAVTEGVETSPIAHLPQSQPEHYGILC
jgi:hypothetical protein